LARPALRQIVAYFRIHKGAFDEKTIQGMRAQLLDSRLLGKSQLVGGFRQSQGFGIVFTRPGIGRVRERFPELTPFLNLILSGSSDHGVQPGWRAIFPAAQANAFYINVLVLSQKTAVTRHVDGTLQTPSGVATVVPRTVSVLYLAAPNQSDGGSLKLYANHIPVKSIQPEPGLVVHFRGTLSHEILPLTRTNQTRESVVCEQYVFSKRVAARLPEFEIQSRAFDPIFAASSKYKSFGDLLIENSKKEKHP
jgi:hypothetical protein